MQEADSLSDQVQFLPGTQRAQHTARVFTQGVVARATESDDVGHVCIGASTYLQTRPGFVVSPSFTMRAGFPALVNVAVASGRPGANKTATNWASSLAESVPVRLLPSGVPALMRKSSAMSCGARRMRCEATECGSSRSRTCAHAMPCGRSREHQQILQPHLLMAAFQLCQALVVARLRDLHQATMHEGIEYGDVCVGERDAVDLRAGGLIRRRLHVSGAEELRSAALSAAVSSSSQLRSAAALSSCAQQRSAAASAAALRSAPPLRCAAVLRSRAPQR